MLPGEDMDSEGLPRSEGSTTVYGEITLFDFRFGEEYGLEAARCVLILVVSKSSSSCHSGGSEGGGKLEIFPNIDTRAFSSIVARNLSALRPLLLVSI